MIISNGKNTYTYKYSNDIKKNIFNNTFFLCNSLIFKTLYLLLKYRNILLKNLKKIPCLVTNNIIKVIIINFNYQFISKIYQWLLKLIQYDFSKYSPIIMMNSLTIAQIPQEKKYNCISISSNRCIQTIS